MFIHFSGQNGCDHHKAGTPKDPFFTFSARLAQPREQHPPHHQHHLHQCPPWMRMMQAMPGMLSTMGTPRKTLRGESVQKRPLFAQNTREHPFPPGSEVTAQKYSAWSAVVGGTGRPALYLKVGPPGLGLRPYHGPRGLKPPGKATRVHAIKCLRIGPCARCLGTYRFEQCETLGQ